MIIEVAILDDKGKLAFEERKLSLAKNNWKQIKGEYSGIEKSIDGKTIRIESQGHWAYYDMICYDILDIELGGALAEADAQIEKETGMTTEQIVAGYARQQGIEIVPCTKPRRNKNADNK